MLLCFLLSIAVVFANSLVLSTRCLSTLFMLLFVFEKGSQGGRQKNMNVILKYNKRFRLDLHGF